MLSFFTNKKPKKSPRPNYNAKLIKGFEKEHEKLVKQLLLIKKYTEKGQSKKAKQALKEFKIELLAHFMEEDIHLYWYLKHLYKENPEKLQTIHTFEESIKKIQKEVVNFINYYTKEEILFDMVFHKEFQGIIEALSSRIETEEKALYTLYTQEKSA